VQLHLGGWLGAARLLTVSAALCLGAVPLLAQQPTTDAVTPAPPRIQLPSGGPAGTPFADAATGLGAPSGGASRDSPGANGTVISLRWLGASTKRSAVEARPETSTTT